jgi:hypothetical protein
MNRERVWSASVRHFLRFAASGNLPARLFSPPPPATLQVPEGQRLSLEIVSHCWQYAPLLRFQLASLVRNPPTGLDVQMTLFFSRDDADTVALIDAFSAQQIPGIHWNWRALPTPELLRRCIGRNLAALDSTADWLWFTDCDVLFGPGCLDGLARALRAQHAQLVYPDTEQCTALLTRESIFLAAVNAPLITSPDLSFFPRKVSRATGPLQIVRGDVARITGYCRALSAYQQPTRTWRKTHEDRIFRWLMGTQGKGLDIPAVYRIRHLSKGRYGRPTTLASIRRWIRQTKDRWLGR